MPKECAVNFAEIEATIAPQFGYSGMACRMANAKDPFLRRLYTQHSGALLRYVDRRELAGDDASDIAQEAWLRMSRLEHPERLSNARAFLYQIASNLIVDRARRADVERRFAQIQHSAIDPSAGCTPSLERSASASEDLERVSAALEELSPNCRHAFILHRGRDMSYAEIAAEMHVSTSMVEKYIIEALKHLRRTLQI